MRFSIVTPTHNRLEYLPEALSSVRTSVLAGVEADWEHLVFDGGSDDGSDALLRQAAAEDQRLRVVTAPEKEPAGVGRNRLIEQAGGDWIVPLDDDDLLLQRCLFN